MAYSKFSEEELRIQVCKVAKKSFAEKGILGTEMKYIAEQIGIGRATLYRYFPGIRYIAYLVAADYMNELTEKLEKIDTQGLDGYSVLLELELKSAEYFAENHDALSFYNQFDTLFPPPYDCSTEAEIYIESLKKSFMLKNYFFEIGIRDSSIRNDANTIENYRTLGQAITGYVQRTEVLHHEKNKEARMKWLVTTLMESIKSK